MIKRLLSAILFAVLTLNTVRKSHVCDHEAPLENLVPVSNESLHNLVEILKFKTVSHERDEDIDYEEFENMWAYILEAYKIIFEHESVTLEWVNKFTLILKISGEDKGLKPGLFLAHVDVVPVDNQWTSDPFAPSVTSEGKVQARGVFDCKGLVVAHLEAIKKRLEADLPFARDVYWLFPHDEEIGGANGAIPAAKVLKEKFGIGPNGFEFIIDEGVPPTSGVIPFTEDHFQFVGYTAKGGVVVELSVELHNAGHASIPARESSITVLASALDRVARNPQPNMFGKSVEWNTFEDLTPYLPFPASVITANLWLFGPLVSRLASLDNKMNAFIRTTSAITIVEAGYKQNVIPTTARAIIDHRIHPAHSIDGVLTHLRGVINDERVKISILPGSKEPDPMTPVDSPIGIKIRNSIHRTLSNTHVIPSAFIALADSRWLTDLSENIFRFAPLKMESKELSGIHGPDERISVESFGEAIDFFCDFYAHLGTEHNVDIHNEL